MASKSRRFVPRLQALDDRVVPAVSFELQDTYLFVTGDTGANTITITDTGTDTGLTIVGDGVTYQPPTTVTHIFVRADEGDDTVVYDLVAPLTVFRLVDVQLGRGADTYTANIGGQSLAPWVNLQMTAAGQGGGDTMVLNAHDVSTDANSILNVFFDGDGGKDVITLDYTAGSLALGQVILQKDQKH
jgi:hypothetical protein